MPSCSVVVCKNRSATKKYKTDGITYHKFPREAIRKLKWMEATGRGPNYWPAPKSVICSDHFEEKCFVPSKKARRLFEWAVPTLKLRLVFASSLESSDAMGDCPELVAKASSSYEMKNYLTAETPKMESRDKITASSSSSVKNEQTTDFHIMESSDTLANRHVDAIASRDVCETPNIVVVSQDLCGIEDTPRKRKLKIELSRYKSQNDVQKKQIQRLQKKASRYRKRITKLNDIIKELQQKNLVNLDQASHLENFGVDDLIRRYNNKLSCEQNSNARYPPALRAFACTLHFYSPKAYNYVRQKFQTCLPHIRTINKWYQSIDAKPGFTVESFKAIKLKVQSSDNKLLCNVVLDEMAIRHRVEWDGSQMHGYVDICNTRKDSDDLPVAKEALVFLATAINGTWKVPIGYFLVDGVTGEQRSNLVLQCLELLHDTGVQVTSLTFDGCPANITMTKKLGCSFEPDNIKSFFDHPITKTPVFIFPDPCHMLKLLRNAFEANGILFDNNNREINWNHLKSLNDIQEKEKLHLANKLRRGHICFKNQKMKVRLASQLFSNSVADALNFCSSIDIRGLENVEGTSFFLRMVNQLFDVFNSHHMAQLHFKKPLNPHNKEKIFQFLSEAEIYFKNIKLRDGTNVLKSSRKMGFIGFLTCIKSIKSLYIQLIEQEKVIKYLPTYKISQDHLELLFGHIRSHGGCNTNPTARQFQAIYKKLLVKSELRDIENGNCSSIDKISLLTCSSAIQKINITTDPRLQEEDLDDINVLYEIAKFEEEVSTLVEGLSEYSLQVITYIAGFVVHSLLKSIKCDTCVGALLANDKTNKDYDFITLKDKGGLIYPSKDVTLCKQMEAALKASIVCENKITVTSKNISNQLISRCLPQFIGTDLFKEIQFHQYEQSPMNNHLVSLMKAIMEKYLKIRLHFLTKHAQPKISKRQVLNKYLHFSGQ